MKPLLFLDIDGVLNNLNWFKQHKGLCKELDPYNVAQLQRIVEATDCDIVIMSTWRLIHTLEEIEHSFNEAGYRGYVNIIGATPAIGFANKKRGSEVNMWINQNAKRCIHQTDTGIRKVPFVCIDDDSDFLAGQKLVQTNYHVGLTTVDADKVVELLTIRS